MANPTLLDMPIARDGNKNAIPTTDNGATGLLSQQYGWQLINAIPPQQGGKAVKREDFNGALYLLSNLLFYLQKGWQFEWDANQNYYAGCIVKDPNNGKMYQRLNDGTSNTTPHSDTTNWKLWDLSMLANYLPLSGGTLTGSTIDRNVDDSSLYLHGGKRTSAIGSFLQLDGWDKTQLWNTDGGSFILSARGESNEQYILRGGKNILQWGKYNSNQEAMYDLGGSAIVAKSLGANGYVKYADGRIRQWKRIIVNVPANADVGQEITYDISFPNGYPYIAQATVVNSGSVLSDGTYALLDGVTNRTKCGLKVHNGASVAQDITVSVLFEGV